MAEKNEQKRSLETLSQEGIRDETYRVIGKLAKIWGVPEHVYSHNLPNVQIDSKETCYYRSPANLISINPSRGLDGIAEEAMHFLNSACADTVGKECKWPQKGEEDDIHECIGYMGSLSLGAPLRNLSKLRTNHNYRHLIDKVEQEAPNIENKIKSYSELEASINTARHAAIEDREHFGTALDELQNKLKEHKRFKGDVGFLKEKEPEEASDRLFRMQMKCADYLNELNINYSELKCDSILLEFNEFSREVHAQGYKIAENVYFSGLKRFIQRNPGFLGYSVETQRNAVSDYLNRPECMMVSGFRGNINKAKNFVKKILKLNKK